MTENNNLEKQLKNCLKKHDQSFSIPPVCYSDQRINRLELDILFKQQWICIGHINILKKPGDYLTKEVTGIPIVIIRDKTNTIRVFSNSCSIIWWLSTLFFWCGV